MKCAFCEKPVAEEHSITVEGVTWKQVTCGDEFCRIRVLGEFTQFWIGSPLTHLPEQDWETCCFFHVKEGGE